LIVWKNNARIAKGFFKSPILVETLGKASSVVWLESNVEKKGRYYSESDPILKKKVVYSAKVIYKAYVVDFNKKEVAAYKKFVGPDPPKRITAKEIYSEIDYDRTPDAYGIAPIRDLISWLESLPVKNGE